jgi:hypothetical protein
MAQHAPGRRGLVGRVVEHELADALRRILGFLEEPPDVALDGTRLAQEIVGRQHRAVPRERTLAAAPRMPARAHQQRIGMLDPHAPEIGEGNAQRRPWIHGHARIMTQLGDLATWRLGVLAVRTTHRQGAKLAKKQPPVIIHRFFHRFLHRFL